MSPAPAARFTSSATASYAGAIRRTVLADGQLRVVAASHDDTRAILRQAGVFLSPRDEVLRRIAEPGISVANQQGASTVSLAMDARSSQRAAEGDMVSARGDRPLLSEDQSPMSSDVDLEVRRAMPLILHEKGLETQFITTKLTLGEGLASAGVELREGDQVMPSLDTPITAGLHAYIRRAMPVSLQIGDATIDARTAATTVAEVLAEQSVALGDEDRVEPSLESPVEPEMRIVVVRVERELIVEQETLDFEVERRPDSNLEVGQQRIEAGQEGILRREVEIVRENGNEVSRNTTREWVESEPKPGTVYYGASIVVRDMDTPEGEIQYTRAMNVYTTWYNASHGEKPRSSPWYGITATGMRAGRGVVAVDPSVIPLYTRLYIPGYGMAVAGDTGGGVKGAHIDLGFEEGEVSPWRTGWVTVYILD